MAENETPTEESVAEEIVVQEGYIANAECETLKMHEAGAGRITVNGRAEMSQAGAGIIVSKGDVELFQAGAGVVVADRADVKQGFVGILSAEEVTFEQESRVLISAKSAVILGAVCAMVFGVFAVLGDYFVREMRSR